MDRRIDIAVAVAFAAFGLFLIIHAMSIPQGVYRDPVGPRAFFYIFGGVIALGGLVVAAQGFVRLRRTGTEIEAFEGNADEPGHPASAVRAFCVVATFVAYAVTFQWLGYLIATPLAILGALWILNQRRLTVTVPIALIFTLAAYLIFAHVLNVRVPVGPFTQLFRDMGWIYI